MLSRKGPSLPPVGAFDEIAGAVCRGPWAFCWNGGLAAFWSEESGWTVLPHDPLPIEDVVGLPFGVVLRRTTGLVQLAAWGASDWSWRRDPARGRKRPLWLAGRFAIVGVASVEGNRRYHAIPAGECGFGEPLVLDMTLLAPPVLFEVSTSGDLGVLVTPGGVTRGSIRNGVLSLRPCRAGFGRRYLPMPFLSEAAQGPWFIRRHLYPAERLDPRTLEIVPTGLEAPPGFERLWDARESSDRSLASAILDVYRAGPPSRNAESPAEACLGLVAGPGGLVAAVTHTGIVCLAPEAPGGSATAGRHWWSGSTLSGHLASWRLFAGEPDGASDLLDALLDPLPIADCGDLVAGLQAELGLDAGAAILAGARTRRLAPGIPKAIRPLRKLFATSPMPATESLRAGLEDPAPLVALLSGVALLARTGSLAPEGHPLDPPGDALHLEVLRLLGRPELREMVLYTVLEAGFTPAPGIVADVLRNPGAPHSRWLVRSLAHLVRPGDPVACEVVETALGSSEPDLRLSLALNLASYTHGEELLRVAVALLPELVIPRLERFVLRMRRYRRFVTRRVAVDLVAALIQRIPHLPELRRAADVQTVAECLRLLSGAWRTGPRWTTPDAADPCSDGFASFAAELASLCLRRAFPVRGRVRDAGEEVCSLRRAALGGGVAERSLAEIVSGLDPRRTAAHGLALAIRSTAAIDSRLGAALAGLVLASPVMEDWRPPGRVRAFPRLHERLRSVQGAATVDKTLRETARACSSEDGPVGAVARDGLARDAERWPGGA